MKNYSIAKSRRLRSTPYTSRIESQGVTAYTVYNHMLLPAAFGSIEDSYEHLKKDVQIWDVAAERQVEIQGKDSAKLVPTLQEEVTCYKKKNETLSKDFTAAIEILKDQNLRNLMDISNYLYAEGFFFRTYNETPPWFQIVQPQRFRSTPHQSPPPHTGSQPRACDARRHQDGFAMARAE